MYHTLVVTIIEPERSKSRGKKKLYHILVTVYESVHACVRVCALVCTWRNRLATILDKIYEFVQFV